MEIFINFKIKEIYKDYEFKISRKSKVQIFQMKKRRGKYFSKQTADLKSACALEQGCQKSDGDSCGVSLLWW